MTPAETSQEVDAQVEAFARDDARLRDAVAHVLVGQSDALADLVTVFFAGGHALLEGVPGTGKTVLVRSIATATGVDCQRVQFTPDLLPADVLGCDTLVIAPGGEERIEFRPGPVFTEFLLADEINRGTPRTQSALLEAMQERTVTSGSETRTLSPLFTVFATRNPIEMEGTYPLPEAQLDRFQMLVRLEPATVDDLVAIAERTTDVGANDVECVLTPERIAEMRGLVRKVVAARPILHYAARLIRATQPSDATSPSLVRENVRYGGGARALQALVLAGKVEALRRGRAHLAHEDLRRFLAPVLRHRLILTLDGEARGVDPDDIVRAVIDAVPPEPK